MESKKSLYHVVLNDLDLKCILEVEVINNNLIEASKTTQTDFIKKTEKYTVNASLSNSGLVDDIIKVMDWISDTNLFETTDKYEVHIQMDITETSSEDITTKVTLWDCIQSIYNMCEGESMIQKGTSYISEAYNNLEDYIKLN